MKTKMNIERIKNYNTKMLAIFLTIVVIIAIISLLFVVGYFVVQLA